MSEIDANIIVEGQKTVATIPQDGEIVKDGGEIDATCIVEDSNGKRHKAVKIVNIDDEPSDKSEIDAQVLNNNNELIMVTDEQDGEIIPENNSEIDFHCLVQKDDGKQLSIKTVELDGEIIKTGGAIDTTCVVQGSDGKRYKAVKVFNLGGTSDWKNKPSDWSDIRKDCPANSIALYAGHTADYSQYDNLGFTATCIGGYKVFIDGTQYGTTYASGSTCSITWSTSGITTGDDITTPSALKAHKIWISPATEGNNITDFRCARVAVSGREAQGILWAHFNIDNEINLGSSFAGYNSYYEPLMLSMTAKNNVIKCNKLPMFGQSSDLAAYADNIEYLPIFDLNNNTINGASGSFNLLTTAELEKVILKNGTITGSFNSLAYNATKLKKINTKNVVLQPTFCQQAFQNNQSIEEIPDIDFTNATNLTNFITNAVSLKDTVLDTRAGTGIAKIGCYSTSQYFMSGFKGLRVSNQAPFNNTTPPQINVSYTGMDRSALVQLFNDLPYNVGYEVVGSPTIQDGVVSGFSASDYVKASSLPDFSGDCEIVIPFNVADLSSTQYLMSWIVSGFSCGIKITTQGKIDIYFSRSGDSSTTLSIAGNHTYSTNTNNKMKLVKEGNTLSLYYWDNGWVFDKSSTNENAGTITVASYFRIGVSSNYNPQYPLNGSIDLNETYIKVNDVYWFRGQPTMTKTLSCVGATGTADLTAEDKDIALNKNWALTLS